MVRNTFTLSALNGEDHNKKREFTKQGHAYKVREKKKSN